jgi:CMP-N-acetylneuraminic acid synthetase
VAEALNVDLLDRPRALASDTATVDDAARHALLAMEQRARMQCDAIVLLYANVPIRPPGLIDQALALWHRAGCDCVQSYAPVGKHHPWWMCRVDATDGTVHPWEGDVLNHGVYRRQDLPPVFVPDGGVLVVTRLALMLELGVAPGAHAFFGVDRRGIITEPGAVIDIDTELDAIVADTVLRQRLLVGSTP